MKKLGMFVTIVVMMMLCTACPNQKSASSDAAADTLVVESVDTLKSELKVDSLAVETPTTEEAVKTEE